MKRYVDGLITVIAFIVGALGLMASARAQGPITWNWQNPVSYNDCTDANCTNGTPLPATAITSATILYGPCTGTPVTVGTPTQSLTVQGGVTHATSPVVGPGLWCGTVASNVGTNAGLPSNAASVTVPLLKAGAPAIQTPTSTGGLKTTGTAVYLVTQVPNGYAFTQVGTVPIGSPCIANLGVNQYNVVDQTQVTVSFSTAVQPLAVVSLCQ